MVNLIVTLPFDGVIRPRASHENIIYAIVFPFVNRKPWKLQGTKFVVGGERELQKLWEKKEGSGGNCLCKILVSVGSLENFPGNMVWKILLRSGKRKPSSD